MKPDADLWWRQALADLAAAELLLNGESFFAASWFAQQAVEKGTKALFVQVQGKVPPRTHDLNYLGRAVSAPHSIAADLRSLNPLFQRTRYPNFQSGSAPVDDVTEYDAIRDLNTAKGVFGWLAQELGIQFHQS